MRPQTKRAPQKTTARRSRTSKNSSAETDSKESSSQAKEPVSVPKNSPPQKLNRKQIAALRAKAHHRKTMVHIGKEGLTAATYRSIDICLKAQELIKIKCLESAVEKYMGGIKEMANLTAMRLNAEVVQLVGHTFTIFRQKYENSQFEMSATGVSTKKIVAAKKRATFDKMGRFKRQADEV